MNNYTYMTDGEINEAAHTDLGWACDRGDHGDERPVWSKDGTFMVSCPDYCNDWAAIGPIIDLIVNDGVTFSVNRGGLLTSALGQKFNVRDIEVDCGNLKRAYAICFLMMQDAKQVKIPLSQNTKAEALAAIDTALGSGKSYAVDIKLHDNSLKARQRALANIWYRQADEHFGEVSGYTEAYCKYRWGLVLLSQDDPDQIMMISRMLSGHSWEDKVEIIRTMSVYFPVMRSKGGLDAEEQALYLKSIQKHYAENGLILSSPREDDLLKCRQDNTR